MTDTNLRRILIPVLLLVTACSQTKFLIEKFEAPELKLESIRTVALMKIQSEYLSEKEALLIDEKFKTVVEDRFKSIRFVNSEESEKTLVKNNSLKVWTDFWDSYLRAGQIEETALFDIAEVLKVNAVLHGQVLEVDKVYGEHRKTVGKTTAKMKYALFSLKSGKLLWEATITGTQKNAHSDQPVPKAIEAVNIAVTNLVEELPFNE